MGTDRLQSLNRPQPIRVTVDGWGYPHALTIGKRQFRVASVVDRWLVEEGWWCSEPVQRLYFSLELVNGRLLTVYRDIPENRWWQQRA